MVCLAEQATGGDYIGLSGSYMTYVTNTITVGTTKGTYLNFHDQVTSLTTCRLNGAQL